jgi:predicted transcriptional regulator
MSQAMNVKDEIRKLVDELPEDCTWDDAMYRIYVRQTVEAGLEDVAAGRTVSHDAVRREFGLES